MSLNNKPEPFTENAAAIQDDQDDFFLLRAANRETAERHVVRKLDIRLMPTVAVIYLMNYIDVRVQQFGSGGYRSDIPSLLSSVWLSVRLDFRV